MHDLLEEMGREIVRQESIHNPGERSQLWDHEDIFSVLKNNTGTRAIRSICLDMSKVEEVHLNPEAFNNMQNLRFLKFYGSKHGKKVPESDSSALCHILRFLKRENSNYGKKVHGFEKLKFYFYETRHFYFLGYPAKSLPSNFNPKNLVALYMPNSKVKKLWTSNQVFVNFYIILVNLKHIDLSDSKHLHRILDLSLMPNLESLILEDCTNLFDSFSSIHNLHKLVILNLRGCRSFNNLPINDSFQSLREVYLSGCSNLKKVPYLPNKVENLYLDRIAIKEFPSIGHLFRLVNLIIRKCSRLERLPDNIRELKSLKCLYLSSCSKLDRLPNDMGNLQSLEVLELEEISFAEIPTFMTSLINLETLSLTRCKMQKQSSIPLVDLSVFQRMRALCLIDCCIEVLPSNIGQLLSLEYLDIAQNNLETLPESIKDLSKLEGLYLSNCQRLKYLPKLPSSLRQICAEDCVSLESISSLFLRVDSFIDIIDFANCLKLKLEMTDALLLNIERSAADHLSRQLYHLKNIAPFWQWASIYYPGCEIPKWFDIKSNGSFIKFPEDWVNDNLFGFALCVVVSLHYQKFRNFRVGFRLIINGEIISRNALTDSLKFWLGSPEGDNIIESDHIFITYNCIKMPGKFPPLNLNSQGGVEFFVEHATKEWYGSKPNEKMWSDFIVSEK
ncbi:disease resistance protein RPP2B-like [Mangifera indica]|uniref:disease resistance protein RPP2B-like n=1 Tax=Mangifera indica TaxID=29780 RepID=UPI001CF99060|nr:disease resistance protein RPP2B-like [Mangifera indica]